MTKEINMRNDVKDVEDLEDLESLMGLFNEPAPPQVAPVSPLYKELRDMTTLYNKRALEFEDLLNRENEENTLTNTLQYHKHRLAEVEHNLFKLKVEILWNERST